MLETNSSIIKVSWKGIVTTEVAAHILETATKEMLDRNMCKILLDRERLELYTKGARVWIKEFFSNKRATGALDDIDKVACVRPVNSEAIIYAHLVSSNIKIAFPYWRIEEYENEQKAIEWLDS